MDCEYSWPKLSMRKLKKPQLLKKRRILPMIEPKLNQHRMIRKLITLTTLMGHNTNLIPRDIPSMSMKSISKWTNILTRMRM